MSFAIGTGVQLGSATGYLFLDPRQFTRGLAATASEVDRFYKATAARANAAARQTQASIRAVQAETRLAAQSHGELNRLRNTAAQSAQAFAQTTAATSAAATASLTRLERDYETLNAARRRTFAGETQQIQKRVAAVEAAQLREVEALRNVQRVREANARRFPRVAAIVDEGRRIDTLERMTKAELTAEAAARRASARRIAAERSLTAAAEGNVNTRIRAYQRETAALERASVEQAAARRATQVKLAQQAVGVATKTFLATGLAIAASTAAFAQFESAMFNVQAISQDTDEEIANMTEGIRQLSVELGKSPTELAKGLYEVAQAGFRGQQAFDILETAARAAAAGMTTVEDAAKPLISVINAYGDAAGTAEDISDKLFAGVKAGIFTFEELAQQIGDNVPLAAQLNVSLDELVASYIVLTKQGNSLAESTTQVNGILRAFLKPTEELAAVIHKAGFESGAAAVETLGLGGALALATQATDGNNEALAAMFPLIRGLRGVVAIATNQFGEYDDALQLVADSTEGVGDTQEVLAKQMESTSFQLRQAREQIRGAIIDFGEGLAPAVLTAAKGIGTLAQNFSELSPQMQATIGHVTLFAFGLSGLAVVVAKLYSTFQTLKIAVQSFNATLLTTRTLLITSGIGLLIVAIGVLAELYLRSKNRSDELNKSLEEQKRVADQLEGSYEQLNETIQNLILNSLGGLASKGQRAQLQIQATAASVNDSWIQMGKTLEDVGRTLKESPLFQPSLFAGSKAEYDAAIQRRERLLKVEEQLTEARRDLEHANEAEKEAIELVNKALGDQRVDIDQVLAEVNLLLEAWDHGVITTEEFRQKISDISGNLGAYRKDAEDAADATSELAQAQQELITTIDDMTQATLESITGQKDLVSWLRGVQGGLAGVDETAAQLINRMRRQDVGGILEFLGLSEGTQPIARAVELQRALEKVNDAIARTEEAIENNADDMSMWSGRIDLVTDTLGGNTDVLDDWLGMLERGEVSQDDFNNAVESGLITFDKLNALHAQGLLTDQEYNDIREAGIFLLQRSVGGLRDERVEQAKLLPLLAEYVRKHDEADGAIRDATQAQKEFIAAMNSSQAQTFLQTLQILAYLAAIGAIPAEKVTQFIADSAAADPIISGLVDDLGLLDEGVTAEIDAKATGDLVGTDGKFHLPTLFDRPDTSEVDEAKKEVATPVQVPVQLQATGGKPVRSSVGKEADVQAENIPEADTRDIQVNVDIEIDDKGKKSLDDIYKKINSWISEVTTTFKFTGGANATGPQAGGGESTAFTNTYNLLTNEWPESVSTSFTLTGAQGDPFVNITNSAKAADANLQIINAQIVAKFIKLATDATNFGDAAGSGFKNALGFQLIDALNQAVSIAGSIDAAMGINLYDEGLVAGGSFVAGFALALAGGVIAAYAGAYAIGAAAKAGVQAALQSGSPSRVALSEGENFADSLVQGMRNRELDVAKQARSLGVAMRSGVGTGAFDRHGAMSSLNPGSQNILFGQTFVPSQANTNILVQQQVTVPAANFPEWIRTMQYVQNMDQGFSTTLASKRGR
jgi:TP901 family phage tail tape measure protein